MLYFLCYSPRHSSSGGGDAMSIRAFVHAVVASVVAYYICQWLDSLLR